MKILYLILGLALSCNMAYSQASLNLTGDPPHSSAAWDVQFTDKGVLIPRMTQAQRNAITTPATSLIIYQTDNTPGYYYYDGSIWRLLGGYVAGTGISISGNTITNTAPDQTVSIAAGSGISVSGSYPNFTISATGGGGTVTSISAGTPGTQTGTSGLTFSSNPISSTGTIALSNTGVTAGAYGSTGANIPSITVDAQGRLTSASNRLLTPGDIGASPSGHTHATLSNGTGIAAFSYNGSSAATVSLANTGVSPGIYTNATVTVNAQGQITSASSGAGGGNPWLITGNSGTTDGTNFIGTTDNVPFNIRVNNQRSGRITSLGQTILGYQAANSNTSNITTALGFRALFSNTSGNRAVAVGDEAGYYQTTANDNVFVGSRSGYFLQSGEGNTAVGCYALYCYGASGSGPVAGGTENVAIGKYAMFNPTSGNRNVAIGSYAFSLPNTGSENVAIGYWADKNNVSNTSQSIAIGAYAMFNANNAVAIGFRSYAPQANTVILGGKNGVNGATVTSRIGISINEPKTNLHIRTGLAIGSDSTIAVSVFHGGRNSIQISTDLNYGGIHDEHSGYLIYSTMPGGWGSGELHFCTANNWGSYTTGTPALRVLQTGINVNGTWYGSDKRLKTNIKENIYGINEVMKLKTYRYKKHFVDSIANGQFIFSKLTTEEVGFIAQEVSEIIPEVVHKPSDETKEAWGIDYGKLVPILTKAIQEQQSEINALNEKIQLLEKKLLEIQRKE